jgi:hypothetical protein
MPLYSNTPVYLVELFSLQPNELDWSDISADLALSLEAVYWHLAAFEERVIVKVGLDEFGALAGIAFLREDASILATITLYRLDREHVDLSERVEALQEAANLLRPEQLQQALSQIF